MLSDHGVDRKGSLTDGWLQSKAKGLHFAVQDRINPKKLQGQNRNETNSQSVQIMSWPQTPEAQVHTAQIRQTWQHCV